MNYRQIKCKTYIIQRLETNSVFSFGNQFMDSHYPDEEKLSANFMEQRNEGTSLFKDIIIEYSDMQSEHIQASIPYNFEQRELDLGLVLHNHLAKIIPHGYQYQVFYYSNNSGYFVFGGSYPFQELLILREQFASENYIFVKLNRTHPPIVQLMEQPEKKKRKNDRNIKQILQKVAQWRKIQQQNNVTLTQASKTIDIPKKTLDDYFSQIKQGQLYGFDFQQNLQSKIGVLRKFVRQHHKKQQNAGQFKILEQFMKEDQEIKGEEENEEQEQ